MPIAADTLIRQHLNYATANPGEWKRFDSIYDHLLYYLCSMWGMCEAEADDVVQQFRSRFVSKGKRSHYPLYHLHKPATHENMAVYAVAVQNALTTLEFTHRARVPFQIYSRLRMFIGKQAHRAIGWWTL